MCLLDNLSLPHLWYQQLLSCIHALMTRAGKKRSVNTASHNSMTFGELYRITNNNQQYANTDQNEVIKNTPNSLILFDVPAGRTMTQMAVIKIMLYEADPIMVNNPKLSFGLVSLNVANVSKTEIRISGADDPRAISVRFEIVSFHTKTSLATRCCVMRS